MQSIHAATADFEAWLRGYTPLDEKDLAYKHRQMAKRRHAFSFLRGTYYRWAQVWPAVCSDVADAPRVLAVGDLHVENFGTWRDAEGRLIWGINDFDEAYTQAYTNDLVRLAVSAILAVRASPLRIASRHACAAILKGYRRGLERGGRPFVLEEKHPVLRALALSQPRNPVRFWDKLGRLRGKPEAKPPQEARSALLGTLPGAAQDCVIRRRRRVGLGSLGKPRFVALALWDGGQVAREAKAVTPSACGWALGLNGQALESLYEHIWKAAFRCPDPFLRLHAGWVVRRLAPECARIDLPALATVADEAALLRAMGRETANIHLGTDPAGKEIRADLARRPADWLGRAARAMTGAVIQDWEDWQRAARRE